jgi:hypothetical protein
MLLPVHPFPSIRRSQGRGVSRPIALHAYQLALLDLEEPEAAAGGSSGKGKGKGKPKGEALAKGEGRGK